MGQVDGENVKKKTRKRDEGNGWKGLMKKI